MRRNSPPSPGVLSEEVENRGQSHLSETVMVAIGFPVGGDGDEPGVGPFLRGGLSAGGSRVSAPESTMSSAHARVVEERPKGDAMGERTIVDEEGHGPAAGGSVPTGKTMGGSLPDLVGSHDREGDALLGQDVQGQPSTAVSGKPHARGVPAESFPEVSDAPANLRDLLPSGGQGKDGVVIGLGDGVSVTSRLRRF